MRTTVSLLQQSTSEPVLYDLVYKFKKIVGKPNLRDQFKNENQVGYNIDIMKQCARLFVNPFVHLVPF